MLAVRVPSKLEARLSKLAKLTGRPKSFYVRQALAEHLDEIEDTYTALYRLENPARRWTLDELDKGLEPISPMTPENKGLRGGRIGRK